MQQTALAGRGFFNQLASFEVKPAKNSILWFSALFGGWAFDFLFWGKPPGISFFIFILVLLVAMYAVAISASVEVSPRALLLLPAILFFSLGFALRSEPLTLVLDFFGTLGLLALLVSDLTAGRWFRYRFGDYVVAAIHLGIAGLVGGAVDLTERRINRPERVERSRKASLTPVLKGLLMALPLLLIFGVLLASADPIFSKMLKDPIRWIRTERLAEYSFRVVLIAVLGYAMAGVFLHAVRRQTASLAEPAVKEARPGPIGYVEGSVALSSVLILFALFVTVQFRYFFAGRSAVTRLGLTYSEYARRGFGELVGVAVLTLLLLVGMSMLVRRDSDRRHLVFSSLSTALVLMTGVILISAFDRLLMYENAYGFTRLRTYAHIFMVWLAIVLIAMLWLQWFKGIHRWSLVVLLAAIGFTATLNIVGVDSLIVRNNIDRAVKGAKFDPVYLSNLSSDSVPLLIDQSRRLPAVQQRELLNLTRCNAGEEEDYPWQSFNLPRERAEEALHRLERSSPKATCPVSNRTD